MIETLYIFDNIYNQSISIIHLVYVLGFIKIRYSCKLMEKIVYLLNPCQLWGKSGKYVFPDHPDALACTSGFLLNVYATTVYFCHAANMYCQVYAL